MRDYKIKEMFYSLQGEGINAGRAAFFIRFAGCNLQCPFCDTDFRDGMDWSIWRLEEFLQTQDNLPGLVVLTGGEPTLQVDQDFINLAYRYFGEIAMETNGSRPLKFNRKDLSCLTISPKTDYIPAAECVLNEATEIKVVFDGKNNPEENWGWFDAKYHFIQPCDTGNALANASIMRKAVEYVKENPNWRLSLQTQKLLHIQ